MVLLQPAMNARALLGMTAPEREPVVDPTYAAGFEDLFATLPKLDPRIEDPEALAMTVQGMDRIAERVRQRLAGGELEMPRVGDGQFGRTFLGMESTTRVVDGFLTGGTNVVLGHWGKGFATPIHGHAPGYISEDLILGALTISEYEITGDPSDRLVVLKRATRPSPGRYVSLFDVDRGQEVFSSLIHAIEASEFSITLHYLPDSPRNARGSRFTAVENRG